MRPHPLGRDPPRARLIAGCETPPGGPTGDSPPPGALPLGSRATLRSHYVFTLRSCRFTITYALDYIYALYFIFIFYTAGFTIELEI